MGATDPFLMGPTYTPAPGIRRMLSGTPAIVGMLPLQDMLELVGEVGIDAVRAKSLGLTEYAVALADQILAPIGVAVASPRDPELRGGHVTLTHPAMREVTAALWEQDVIPDYRDPGGLRIGLSPLSTSFAEVERGLGLVRETRQPDRRRPPVLARNGPTSRGPASRLSSRRASRLMGCARYSPRITPAARASATDAAVTMARTPRLEAAASPAVSSDRPRKIERPGSSGTIAETTTTRGGTRAQPATPYATSPITRAATPAAQVRSKPA